MTRKTGTKLQVHVDSLDDMGRRFKSAWKRAEAGETVDERHITFESWEGLSKALTGKRLELLRYLHKHPEKSIRSLSQNLHRDYRRVYDDVKVLRAAGLISNDDLYVECDRIQTDIAL